MDGLCVASQARIDEVIATILPVVDLNWPELRTAWEAHAEREAQGEGDDGAAREPAVATVGPAQHANRSRRTNARRWR